MSESLPAHVLDSLFTMCFDVDEQLRVSNPSGPLASRYSQTREHRTLSTLFDVHRPGPITEFDDIRNDERALVLLVAKDKSIALRGQFVMLSDGLRARFVGTPWLPWMSANRPDVRFNLTDFPKFDAQLDQAFHLATQSSMVEDLEQLNAELTRVREAELDANRMRAEFFAMMSHEMRTPLNAVINALSLLKDPRRTPDRERLTNVAQDAADHLLEVINYVLDYSKIDAGAMILTPEQFSIESTLKGVIGIVQSRAEEKGVLMTYDVDSSVPSHLLGDEQKLRQILMNLVGNAIKFTDDGRVNINVVAKSSEGDHLDIQIRVMDTGCGIAASQLEEIFEPYWTRQSIGGELGTGLGLNISRRLAELMHGQISVESIRNQGSCFTVVVPMECATDTSSETSNEAGARSITFDGRVLIVDDNATNLLLQQLVLEGMGLDVTTVDNGPASIELATAGSFDLVLMDISMPGMDGIEAMQHIKQLPSPPPVVALTAHVGENLARDFCAKGFDGFLQKPVVEADMLRELERWLGSTESGVGVGIIASSAIDKMIRQIGRAGFEKVRQLFVEEAERRIATILDAWVRRDLETVARESHALAGSSSSFGGERLYACLKQIEIASKERDLPVVIDAMQDLRSIAAQTFASLLQHDHRSAG